MKRVKKHKKVQIIILMAINISLLITCVLNINNSNAPYNQATEKEYKHNDKDLALEVQGLDSDNLYSGIGNPWNVTHWANRTFYNTEVSYDEGIPEIIGLSMGDNPWEGYRLDSKISELYDKRNGWNGTFDFGPDDGNSDPWANHSATHPYINNNPFQNWTFHSVDVGITPNNMSGNYYSSGGRDFLELTMTNSSQYIDPATTGTGYSWWHHYDAGDKAMWNSSFHIDRGKLIDCTIKTDVRVPWTTSGNSHMLAFYINDVKVYQLGIYDLRLDIGDTDWRSTPLEIPMAIWTNKSNVFSGNLNDTEEISVSISLEAIGSNTNVGNDIPNGLSEEFQRVDIASFEVITKAEVKPDQIGLQINSTDVNSLGWGRGELNLEPNMKWESFDGNFYSNITDNDIGTLGTHSIELNIDSNYYISRNALDTTYETQLTSIGTQYSVQNNSNVDWSCFNYISVPDGYVQDKLTVLMPKDVNITGIFEPQFPTVNRLGQCDTTTKGRLQIPVSSLSTTPDGFWKLEGVSPNYCDELNLFTNTSGSWEKTKTINAGEYVNIQANMSFLNDYVDISDHIDQTYAQLKIRLPNGTIWAEQDQQVQLNNKGFVNFTSFQIPNITSFYYVVGEYEAIVTWNNSFSSFSINETGIITSKFTVIHNSYLNSYQDQYFFDNIIENSSINLRVIFRDFVNNDPILGANVYTYGLPYPSGLRRDFSEIGSGYYFLEFNISGAPLGNNTFTVFANSSLYENVKINITVFVIRESLIDAPEYPIIQASWNENFTIHVNYTEKYSGINLDGSVSHNWDGDTHISSGGGGYINITCNTSRYLVNDIHNITINIEKEGWQTQSLIINIELVERPTYIDYIRLDNLDKSNITLNSGDFLNITMRFNDFILSGDYIGNASAYVLGENLNLNFTMEDNLLNSHYNFTLNTSKLEVGTNFLTLYANKDNYSLSTTKITIFINIKDSDYRLYLNTENYTDGRLFRIEINQEINITARYFDEISKSHISGATATLVSIDTLGPHPVYEQYNTTINSNVLGEGTTILTLNLEKLGWETQSIVFTIEVFKRGSNLTLYIDGSNKTNEPSVDLLYYESTNLTIVYLDNETGFYIPDAIISIKGESFSKNLTEIFGLGQYYLDLDSTELGPGVHFLTIFAQRNNYKEHTLLLRVSVEGLLGDVDTEDGKTTIEATTGEDVTITIVLKDSITREKISGAFIEYTWEEGEDTFEETNEDGVYETTIKNPPEGTYTITITVQSTALYTFERLEVTLDVNTPAVDNWLFFVLSIVAISSAIGLTLYLVAYIRVLQYDKPVRKVRNHRRKINKRKEPRRPIISREVSFNETYTEYSNIKGLKEPDIAQEDLKNKLKPSSESKERVKLQPPSDKKIDGGAT